MKKILLPVALIFANRLLAQNYIVDNLWGIKVHASSANLTESNCRSINYLAATNEYLFTANEHNTNDPSSTCTLNKLSSTGAATTMQSSIANNKSFPIPLSGTAFCTTWFPISDKVDLNIASLSGGANSFLTIPFTGQLSNVAVFDMVAANGGGYFIVGQGTNVGGVASAYLAKISATGILENLMNLAYIESTARAIKLLSDGSIIVAGHYINSTNGQCFIKKVKYSNASFTYDATFNSSGTAAFSYDILSQVVSEAYALEIDNSDNIYVGGVANYQIAPTTPRLCYARTDKNGIVTNTYNVFGTTRSGAVYCMRKMKDGNILMGGFNTINGAQGLYLEKISSSTGLIDTTFTFKSSNDRAFYNISTSNEEVIFGISESNGNNEYVICGQNFQKGFYTKIRINTPTSIPEFTDQQDFTIFPNPTSGEFSIVAKEGIKNIYATDILGRVVGVRQSSTTSFFMMNKGNYVLHVTFNDNSIGSKLIHVL